MSPAIVAFIVGVLIFQIVTNCMILLVTVHLWHMHTDPLKYGFGQGLTDGNIETIREMLRTESDLAVTRLEERLLEG